MRIEQNNSDKQESAAPTAMQAPSISLPKGGGAIHGMGEKFAANPVRGTGAMTVPLATSPGRGGFGPQLTPSYDSGSGNGPFGFGWSLSIPSIVVQKSFFHHRPSTALGNAPLRGYRIGKNFSGYLYHPQNRQGPAPLPGCR